MDKRRYGLSKRISSPHHCFSISLISIVTVRLSSFILFQPPLNNCINSDLITFSNLKRKSMNLLWCGLGIINTSRTQTTQSSQSKTTIVVFPIKINYFIYLFTDIKCFAISKYLHEQTRSTFLPPTNILYRNQKLPKNNNNDNKKKKKITQQHSL